MASRLDKGRNLDTIPDTTASHFFVSSSPVTKRSIPYTTPGLVCCFLTLALGRILSTLLAHAPLFLVTKMGDHKSSPTANATATVPTAPPAVVSLPLVYRLFFLLIEPLSALAGAYMAFFRPYDYLELTHAASAPLPIPHGTTIVLSQLANLYLFFALNEAIVLRSTSNLRVWKSVLFCLLVADFGHLYTVRSLGLPIYWSVADWNAIDWGNIPFVYLGALMRIAFLANVGFGVKRRERAKKRA